MNISKKIEEIRQKPYRVRMQYVWIWVAVSMFFVIILWIFSITVSFSKTRNQAGDSLQPQITKQLEQFQENAPSLEEFTKQLPQDIVSEGVLRD